MNRFTKEEMATFRENTYKKWGNIFPELYQYSSTKLYKILGPTIYGVELIRLIGNERYGIYVTLNSLWEKSVTECLKKNIMIAQVKNKKGLQYHIAFRFNEDHMDDAISCLKKQFFSFEGNIKLSHLFEKIDDNMRENPYLRIYNSPDIAFYLSNKIKIALYIDDKKSIENVLKTIRTTKWDLEQFRRANIDYDQWLAYLLETVNNRDKLVEMVNKNRADKKLAKLPISEIIK